MPSERCLSIQEMLTGQRLCHSESHNDSVLAALNQQRSDGILCDITLIAEEQKFHAHKAVLAACSDYFRNHQHTQGMYETVTVWKMAMKAIRNRFYRKRN
ncbi:unnamed protein product [Gulo gulo]|uniref:BTB domain-containing protein n=1 Tax=Gulo gulo TaxID=48420 RepID=A0A9X9M202_GULGU|nr:unnamed protein product [Gulo gulo]